MKNKLLFFTVLSLLAIFAKSCTHAGGPVKEETLANYVHEVLDQFLPFKIPSLAVNIQGGLSFNLSNSVLNQVNFSSVSFQLTAPDTVLFTLSGLVADITSNFALTVNQNTTSGTAELSLLNSKLTITSYITPDSFKNTASTFTVGGLTLKSSHMDVIKPYWDLLQPIVVDALQREVPNTLMSLDTQEIRTLIMPIIKGVEPIHIPDLNFTVLGVYGGFSNLILENIDLTSATLERGPSDNEVSFALTGLSAYIQNNWEFKDSIFNIDKKGSGHIALSGTSVSITIKISENQGQFYIDLDTSKISIGSLDVVIDGADNSIVQWFITKLEPLVVTAVENTFALVVCILFNGIPVR